MKKILVLGDTIIDKYVYLSTLKISDEAPVITHNIDNIKYLLGGGSNVSRNVTALGNKCDYVGLFDHNEELLKKLFEENNVNALLFKCNNSVPVKTRIMSRMQQICRFDTRNKIELSEDMHQKIVDKVLEKIDEYDSVIFSKYFENFLTPKFVNQISKVCKQKNIFTIIDNRQSNSLEYKNISMLKLNFLEFCNLIGKKINDTNQDVIDNLKKLYEISNYESIVVTRAEKDVVFINKNQVAVLPIQKTEVNDVSGAGDTFVSTVASYYDPNNIIETIKLAILASSISVKKLGTAVVYNYELKENNVVTPLEEKIKQLRNKNKKIVLTNGVFDILHPGHLSLLEQAKKKGDFLVVGINSDRAVKQLKGETRPVNNQEDRKTVLEAIKFVDYVVIFDELNAINLINFVKPDIYVKGGDYTLDSLVEKVALDNIEVCFVDLVPNKSTTGIIKKINNN